MEEELSVVQLYDKLVPFLKIKSLGEDKSNADQTMRRRMVRTIKRRQDPEGEKFWSWYHFEAEYHRGLLSIKCTKDYLWGHYYARLEWDPSPVSKTQKNLGMVRPTFGQFCKFYELDPHDGMDDEF